MNSYYIECHNLKNKLRNDKLLPRQDKIRLFEIESRKYQTLHYNFQRFSGQITFQNSPLHSLNENVYDFILHSVFACQTLKEGNEKVKELSNFISSKCRLNEKPSITIIWICFLEFETYEVQFYPAFKIKFNDNDYQFIDWDKNEFSSWTNFLDNYELPLGLICVPTNGTYEWSKEYNHLSLELFITRAAHEKRLNLSSTSPFVPQFYGFKIWLKEVWNELRELGSQAVVFFFKVWESIRLQKNFILIVIIKLITLICTYKKKGAINEHCIQEFASDITYLFRGSNMDNLYPDPIANLIEYCDNFKRIAETWSAAIKEKDLSQWKKLGMLILKAVRPIVVLVENLSLPQSKLVFAAVKIIEIFLNVETETSPNQIDYEKDYGRLSENHNFTEQLYDVLSCTSVDEQEKIAQCETEVVFLPKNSQRREQLKFKIFRNNEYGKVMENIREIAQADFTLNNKGNYSEVIDCRGNNLGVVGFSSSTTFGVFYV